jgi:hypothetical protein
MLRSIYPVSAAAINVSSALNRRRRPLTEAIAMRSIAGSVSLGLMMLLSVTPGRRRFDLCRRLALLPIVVRGG